MEAMPWTAVPGRPRRRARRLGVLILAPVVACGSPGEPDEGYPAYPAVDRHAAIPADVVKGTPGNDASPPVLHSTEFDEPVPVPVISTAGAEDAPFIPADRAELYFFFAADVRQDASVQIRDPVNGIWVSRAQGAGWGEPELVWLQDPDVLALNGCPFVAGTEMIFCTAREGLSGLHWFRAVRDGAGWRDWMPVAFPMAFDVGELHVAGDHLYYGSARPGGAGGQDIWMLTRVNGEWADPVNISAVNTPADETRPYVSPDGSELWLTRGYRGSPAVFRSRRSGGVWLTPELVVSQFAGEPTLDAAGNLYFVHHFYREGAMIEADIYVARRR